MGLIIEKEKNKEGDEKEDADKSGKDGRKRRKRGKTREKVDLEQADEGGNSKSQEPDTDKKKAGSIRRKLKVSKDSRKALPDEKTSIPVSAEEGQSNEGGGIDVKEIESEVDVECKDGVDAQEGRRTAKEVERDARSSEKTKDCKCDLSCCLKVTEDLDDVQDERGMDEKERKGKSEDALMIDHSQQDDDENSRDGGMLVAETEVQIQNDDANDNYQQAVATDSSRCDELPGGSPFNIRRFHEKKIRYQSSRPTSLETIIEDVAPPFFFQDSIIKSFDGREDYRGGRENLNLFQVRQGEEEEDEEEEREEDGEEEINYFVRKEASNRRRDSQEEDFQEENINILPLRSSRIFRGVIENLNYILENDPENGGVFGQTGPCSLFQEYQAEYPLGKSDSISSSSSSKYDYGIEERLRDISEKDEEEEEEGADEEHFILKEASGHCIPELEQLESVREKFIQNHPFRNRSQKEGQEKKKKKKMKKKKKREEEEEEKGEEEGGQEKKEEEIEYSIISGINQCYQDPLPSSQESKGNVSFSELGCESPQVGKEEGDGVRVEGFHFPKDVAGGSDIEASGTQSLLASEMTSRIDGVDSNACNIDGRSLAMGSFDLRDFGGWSRRLGDHVQSANVRNELDLLKELPMTNKGERLSEYEFDDDTDECVGGKMSSLETNRELGLFEDGSCEGGDIGKGKLSRYKDMTALSSTSGFKANEPNHPASESVSEALRKVSFTVYIQYEAVNSEMASSEMECKREIEADLDVQDETQLAMVAASVQSNETVEIFKATEESLGTKYQRKLIKAIQSLDSLNDQIVEFIFSGAEFEEDHGGSPKQREALKSSMSLMRRLLVDAQSKFRKMVEDNKQLASRIDGELQTAHQEVNLLRQELADTNRRITQIQEHNHHNMDDFQRPHEGGVGEGVTPRPDTPTTNSTINGPSKYHSESSSNQLAEDMSQLRLENEKLSARNRSLQREVEELRRVKESMVEEDLQLKPQINQMTMELTHAKEALSALKADRKRLKAEKFDLLNQMKQLYATLEDKEKELRDFIRNYEQRMKESDESLRHLAAERDETEREKWNILKHARDESEKVVKLSAQLGMKDAAMKRLQDDLEMVRKQLTSVGYYSDAESVRTNGLPTPTASTPTCSPQPISTPTPTPNGRGSSADSGVRLSSDRDSTASHDGTPTITVEHGSFDCDTLSVCSSATAASLYYHACGVGTPKESPSLSPLYATPSCIKGEDRGGDSTPTGGPTPSGNSLNSSAMSGLASSNASSGGLSRSAEQLCERLAEAGEAAKVRGTNTLSRKSNKSGGTWGSISRVFARQKKRAALDASLYDGNGSDKRASWSPSSSLCVSPLTEESYSEKLRLLEEAQHIPLERWKAPTVLAWMEVTLGMPQYGAMCAENVRSGKVLLELSDSELEAGLGISHPMHRKKLRLAIEELREPRLSRFPRISALGHTWVSSEWLPDLGLPQYCDAFANNLVDGRLLEALTKKELEKHLGVHRKFHQASIIHGVHLLRIVRFDRQILAERRRQSENVDCDPIVWTNIRWVRWARSIDLAEYADNLKDSGVHGALVVLESSFTSDTMATALGIPQSKNIIRRHLATELESLVNPARQQLDEQARYAKLERRRQEKLAAGGSLGRSFSRSYGTGLEKAEKDKRRASLRGSLSRALGLRVREEIQAAGNGGESSSSGGQSPAVSSRAHPHHPPQARPRSSVMPAGVYVHHETHRRVKSIGDIETITVTPV